MNDLHLLRQGISEDCVLKSSGLLLFFRSRNGNYHIRNVMPQDGEALLIDMDTLCCGHPVFEFASVFNACQGFACADHRNIESFPVITYEQGAEIRDRTLKYYFYDKTDAQAEKAVIDICRNEICRLPETVDSLTRDQE